MNFILKIYKKFLIVYNSIFKQKNKEKSHDLQICNSASIIFKIVDNDHIASVVNIPDLPIDYDITNISSDAENYANFLVHITNGLIHDQILNLIKKKLLETDDINNKLFLDNVLYFFTAIENELDQKLISELSNNRPLIRPSRVFNATLS